MTDPNPYRPPEARLADAEGKRGSTALAVLAGLVADVGGTFVGGIIVSFVLGIVMAMNGVPGAEIGEQLAASGPYQVFSLLFGLSFTVLGGYVCARVANYRELWHGMLLGIASLVVGEFLLALLGEDVEIWQRLAAAVLAVPAGIYGASLRRKHKRASA